MSTDNEAVSVSCLAAGSSHSLALVKTTSGSLVVSWGRGEDGMFLCPPLTAHPYAHPRILTLLPSYDVFVPLPLPLCAGQLGHGDAEERTSPQAIFSLLRKDVRFLTCGAEYSVCVAARRGHDDNGGSGDDVYAWGWADFGRYVSALHQDRY